MQFESATDLARSSWRVIPWARIARTGTIRGTVGKAEMLDPRIYNSGVHRVMHAWGQSARKAEVDAEVLKHRSAESSRASVLVPLTRVYCAPAKLSCQAVRWPARAPLANPTDRYMHARHKRGIWSGLVTTAATVIDLAHRQPLQGSRPRGRGLETTITPIRGHRVAMNPVRTCRRPRRNRRWQDRVERFGRSCANSRVRK